MDKNNKARLTIGAVLMCNTTVFLAIGASQFFRVSSEVIFGLQSRTWAFGFLALTIASLSAGIALLATALKAQKQAKDA